MSSGHYYIECQEGFFVRSMVTPLATNFQGCLPLSCGEKPKAFQFLLSLDTRIKYAQV